MCKGPKAGKPLAHLRSGRQPVCWNIVREQQDEDRLEELLGLDWPHGPK